MRAFAMLGWFLLFPLPLAAAPPLVAGPSYCHGDCNFDHRVDVSELVRGTRIAHGQFALRNCETMDGDGDGLVAIYELVRAVRINLEGCPCSGDAFVPRCGGVCGTGSVCVPSPITEACTCVSEETSCGESGAACNGECPLGQSCVELKGAPISGCGCADEAEPCGGEPLQCSGDCPVGSVCETALSTTVFPGPACKCIPETLPCGESAAACNGECPDAFACTAFGSRFSETCGCVPETAVACGSESDPVCGGVCPEGTACATVGDQGCECRSLDLRDCEPGTFPVYYDRFSIWLCLEWFCFGGEFPTCGGVCGEGLTCQAFGGEIGCACAP